MKNIFEVSASDLIEEAAKELQASKEIKPLEWAKFVKTGMHKERAPVRDDWWYVRAASILRKVLLLGPIGVSKLRTKYGGRKRRGYKKVHFYKGSGNILRKMLQQLEKEGLVKSAQKGIHKGKIITPKGISLLNKVANRLIAAKPKEIKGEAKKEELKKEAKHEPKKKELKKKEGAKQEIKNDKQEITQKADQSEEKKVSKAEDKN